MNSLLKRMCRRISWKIRGILVVITIAVANYLRLQSGKFHQSFRHQPDNEPSSVALSTHLLSPSQTNQLAEILKPNFPKSRIEIVISRYKEDVSWSDMYVHLRTIYDKSGDDDNFREAIKIPNVGRESFTYLNHVVQNFDRLADVTVFTHGALPSSGYRGHRVGGGHLLMNSTFHDFVLSNGKFVFTGAVWLPSLAHSVRAGFNKGKVTREAAQIQCPTPALSEPGGSVYKFDLDDKPHLHVLHHMASRCREENSSTCTGFAFWDEFVRLPRPRHDIAFFAQGAIFAVRREQIRQRPLREYQSLLKEVSRSSDPSAGFFLEWFWYYIFTSDISPCPVTGEEFVWAEHEPFYKTLPLQDRISYPKYVDPRRRPFTLSLW